MQCTPSALARGVCEPNTSEKLYRPYNNYESRDLFMQSTKVRTIYSKLCCIQNYTIHKLPITSFVLSSRIKFQIRFIYSRITFVLA